MALSLDFVRFAKSQNLSLDTREQIRTAEKAYKASIKEEKEKARAAKTAQRYVLIRRTEDGTISQVGEYADILAARVASFSAEPGDFCVIPATMFSFVSAERLNGEEDEG